MALTTSARDTANRNRYWNSLEERYDSEMVDIVSEANELWWVLQAAGRTKFHTGGGPLTTTLMAGSNNTFQAFQGTDTLTIDNNPDVPAASWDWKNYKMSLQHPWEESIRNSGDLARLDLLQHDMDVLAKDFGTNLNTVVKEGQGNGSRHIQGLEDAIYAATTTTGTSPAVFKTRTQATTGTYNTYAGVDRTGTDAAAVGWRNLAFDLDEAADDIFTMSAAATKVLRRAHQLLTRGTSRPDLILMSLVPYEDWEGMTWNVSSPLVRFEKSGMGADSANLPFEHLKFKNAMIVKVDGLEYSTVGGSGDVTDGSGIIYLLNTDTWELDFESQAYFSWTDWIQPAEQLVSVSHNVVRMIMRCLSPRENGVIFNYNN